MLPISRSKRVKAIIGVVGTVCLVHLLVGAPSTPSESKNNSQTGKRLVPGPEQLCPNDTSTRQKKNIFFLETSGEVCLTARQACSVEAAARMNPLATVTVHMETGRPFPQMEENDGHPEKTRSCSITENLFAKVSNARMIREDLLAYTTDTPLWQLVESGALNRSRYPMQQRSDAIRVALIWKLGGFYMDFDCMTLRRLDCLQNTLGVCSYVPSLLENAVMTFEARHPFVHFLMEYMVSEYDPKDYFSLGQLPLTFAFQEFCNHPDNGESIPTGKSVRCAHNVSLAVQPAQAFFALNDAIADYDIFYSAGVEPERWGALRHSFITHVTKCLYRPNVPVGSLYNLLAREYCPATYQMAVQETGRF